MINLNLYNFLYLHSVARERRKVNCYRKHSKGFAKANLTLNYNGGF